MIDLEACRVRANEQADLRYVGNVIEAADAMQNASGPVPAAYVSTAREGASPNKNTTGKHTQLVQTVLSVLFVVGAQRADGKVPDQVEALKNDLIALFMAWTPDGNVQTPFDYVSYSIRMMADGLVWAELLFSCKSLLTKAA
jgi:hypothetical protein